MSRAAGFSRADIDTGLLADPKVVRLVRQVRDPNAIAVATCLYVGLVLASWKAGERVTLDESLPAWFLDPVDDVRAALAAAELVDADGRIPAHAWESWYDPAYSSREKLRDKWAEANRRRGRNRGGTADVTAEVPPRVHPHHDTTRHDTTIPFPRGATAPRRGDSTPARGVTAAPDGIPVDRV